MKLEYSQVADTEPTDTNDVVVDVINIGVCHQSTVAEKRPFAEKKLLIFLI